MESRFLQIPPPTLATPDYDATLARVKADYEEKTGHRPDVNDPETFELEQLSYEISQLKDVINSTAQQNLLAYSDGPMLDNLGLLVGTTRLPASAATSSATIAFVSDHPAFVLTAGYQVLAKDGQTVFSTTADIAIGKTQKTLNTTLTAETAGTVGNGFLPGEIAQIVTQNAYVQSVANTTTSQGGAETESDDSLAQRIFLAPSQFSVAGPYDAYRYFALSTSAAISDVAVESPEPCDITICAVLAGGGVPDEALKASILAMLSDKTTRPLGDRLTVIDPEPVEASGDLNVQVYRDSAPLAEQIRQTIEQRATALTESWSGKLGADVVPESLEAIGQAVNGVYRCTTTIEYKRLNKRQFPMVTVNNVNVTLIDEDSNT